MRSCALFCPHERHSQGTAALIVQLLRRASDANLPEEPGVRMTSNLLQAEWGVLSALTFIAVLSGLDGSPSSTVFSPS